MTTQTLPAPADLSFAGPEVRSPGLLRPALSLCQRELVRFLRCRWRRKRTSSRWQSESAGRRSPGERTSGPANDRSAGAGKVCVVMASDESYATDLLLPLAA